MKNLFSITTLIAWIFLIACGSEAPNLDWNKTAVQQNLKIGDAITVEGVAFSSVGRDPKIGRDSDNKLIWVKKEWESKIHTPVYDPNEPDDVDFNPNAPIGVVICTIYNPSAYEDLSRLDDMYPDKSPDYPELKHRIKFTGAIYSFEREFVESYNDKPGIYLACVRIHVTDLDVISSQSVSTDNQSSKQPAKPDN